MPEYLFKCDCGHQQDEYIEVVNYQRENDKVICRVCRGKMNRVFTSPTVKLVGAGFYRTDNASTTARKWSGPKYGYCNNPTQPTPEVARKLNEAHPDCKTEPVAYL